VEKRVPGSGFRLFRIPQAQYVFGAAKFQETHFEFAVDHSDTSWWQRMFPKKNHKLYIGLPDLMIEEVSAIRIVHSRSSIHRLRAKI
jgi:hypothetical protein